MKTDCLHELDEQNESHAKWLHEWLLKHPQPNARLNRTVIVAALIVAAAILVAAFIVRPKGERFKGIGNNRVLDTETGAVKWAEPQ